MASPKEIRVKNACREVLLEVPAGERNREQLDKIIEYAQLNSIFPPNLDDREVLDDLCQNISLTCVGQNTILFLQGQAATSYFIIFNGAVEILQVKDEKQVKFLEKKYCDQLMQPFGSKFQRSTLGNHLVTLPDNKGFGELALIKEGATRATAALCARPTELIEVGPELYARTLRPFHLDQANVGDAFRLLQSFKLFEGLGGRATTDLAYRLELATYPPHARVATKGERIECIYLLARGEVKQLDVQGGVSMEVAVRSQGTLLGAREKLHGRPVFDHSYEALTAVELYRMSLADFKVARKNARGVENYLGQEAAWARLHRARGLDKLAKVARLAKTDAALGGGKGGGGEGGGQGGGVEDLRALLAKGLGGVEGAAAAQGGGEAAAAAERGRQAAAENLKGRAKGELTFISGDMGTAGGEQRHAPASNPGRAIVLEPHTARPGAAPQETYPAAEGGGGGGSSVPALQLKLPPKLKDQNASAGLGMTARALNKWSDLKTKFTARGAATLLTARGRNPVTARTRSRAQKKQQQAAAAAAAAALPRSGGKSLGTVLGFGTREEDAGPGGGQQQPPPPGGRAYSSTPKQNRGSAVDGAGPRNNRGAIGSGQQQPRFASKPITSPKRGSTMSPKIGVSVGGAFFGDEKTNPAAPGQPSNTRSSLLFNSDAVSELVSTSGAIGGGGGWHCRHEASRSGATLYPPTGSHQPTSSNQFSSPFVGGGWPGGGGGGGGGGSRSVVASPALLHRSASGGGGGDASNPPHAGYRRQQSAGGGLESAPVAHIDALAGRLNDMNGKHAVMASLSSTGPLPKKRLTTKPTLYFEHGQRDQRRAPLL